MREKYLAALSVFCKEVDNFAQGVKAIKEELSRLKTSNREVADELERIRHEFGLLDDELKEDKAFGHEFKVGDLVRSVSRNETGVVVMDDAIVVEFGEVQKIYQKNGAKSPAHRVDLMPVSEWGSK